MSKLDLVNIASKYSKEEKYDFTGYLMYKDKEIAEIKDTELVKVIDKTLFPVIMLNENLGSYMD